MIILRLFFHLILSIIKIIVKILMLILGLWDDIPLFIISMLSKPIAWLKEKMVK